MITDQEVMALGNELVDSMTPEQRQLLLKSILDRLTAGGKSTAAAVEQSERAAAPKPVMPPLPPNMSPETAQKLANSRRKQVDVELARAQGVDRKFAEKIALTPPTAPQAPAPTGGKPADIVEHRQKIEAQQREQEKMAQQEAEEEERIAKVLAKREAEARAKTEAAKTEQPVRVKTLAEATGHASRKDEIATENFKKNAGVEAAAAFTVQPQLNDENHPLPPAKTQADIMTESLCPSNLKEPQPQGFRPFDLLKTQITSYCNNPNLKHGADVLKRFVFDMKDMPTVHVANAILVKFNPIYVLGRHLDGSATKYNVGFSHPSEHSFAAALAYLKQVIDVWSEGGEFEMGEAPGNAKRNLENVRMGDQDGMRVAPAFQAYNHHPKVYVFRPYDDDHQIAVVIA